MCVCVWEGTCAFARKMILRRLLIDACGCRVSWNAYFNVLSMLTKRSHHILLPTFGRLRSEVILYRNVRSAAEKAHLLIVLQRN